MSHAINLHAILQRQQTQHVIGDLKQSQGSGIESSCVTVGDILVWRCHSFCGHI